MWLYEVIFIYDSLNEAVSILLNVNRNDIERIESIDGKMFITLKKKEQLAEKYDEIEFIKFIHKEIGFHNKLMNTYDIATNTIIPYASKLSSTKDEEKIS